MAIKKVPMSKIRGQYKKINIDKKWLLIGLSVWILSFFLNIWPILFLSIFCVANAILLTIDRYINAPIDVEFSTFSAILMTSNYGLKWGIAAAIMTKFAAIIYNKNVRIDHFFMILGYVIAALAANMFPGLSILALGIIVTIIVNLYVVFISKYVTFLSNYEIFMYGMSNMIFNFVLFIGFGDIFNALMF